MEVRKQISDSNIFLRQKPMELLLCLTNGYFNEEKYPSSLAKDSRCTYSHTVHLLQKMERQGLIKFERKGRLKLIKLTEKGEKVAELIRELNRLFKS